MCCRGQSTRRASHRCVAVSEMLVDAPPASVRGIFSIHLLEAFCARGFGPFDPIYFMVTRTTTRRQPPLPAAAKQHTGAPPERACVYCFITFTAPWPRNRQQILRNMMKLFFMFLRPPRNRQHHMRAYAKLARPRRRVSLRAARHW